jgi:hypothetical protein
MVVHHLEDHDGRDGVVVDPARAQLRWRLMLGAKDEPVSAVQVHGVAAGTVAGEQVQATDSARVGEGLGAVQDLKTSLHHRPAPVAEFAPATRIGLRESGQLAVFPLDIDDVVPVHIYNPRGYRLRGMKS